MIKFDAGALRVTILSMNAFGITETRAATAAAKSAGLMLHKIVKQNISLHDHSPEALATKDYPYAARHGAIHLHESGSKALVHPEFRVHAQTGKLQSSLRSAPLARGIGWRVELDPGIAPHAKFVVQGTKVMLPRPVLDDTAQAPDVKRRLLKDIVKTLGSKLRTKAMLRVGGV
jgi:hypothetical protein